MHSAVKHIRDSPNAGGYEEGCEAHPCLSDDMARRAALRRRLVCGGDTHRRRMDRDDEVVLVAVGGMPEARWMLRVAWRCCPWRVA